MNNKNNKLIRKRKWVKWVMWPAVILVALYAVFAFALFDPIFMGSVDRLESLLPGDSKECVTYFLQAKWGDLRSSDFFRESFLENPVRGKVEKAFRLEEDLYGPIGEIETQINDSMPGFLGGFSILDDLAGQEVVVAGYLTGRGDTVDDKIRNSPFVALTRITFKAKFIEALKYGFVRDQVPGLRQRADWFEYDLVEGAGQDREERDRYRYFARIKDVLAVSNDEELIEKVTQFGSSSGLSRESLAQHWWFYYDTRSPGEASPINFWVRVSQADIDLGRILDGHRSDARGGPTDFIRSLFPVPYTTSVLVRAGAEDTHRMPIHGVIRLREKIPDSYGHIKGVHRLQGIDVRKAASDAAAMIPSDGTFAFSWLKMAPRDFFKSFFSSLDEETRLMMFGNPAQPARSNPDKWSDDEMAGRLGDWFEEGVTVALARNPEADKTDFDTWEGGTPKPLPTVTLALKVREGLSGRIPAFMTKHQDRFGWDAPKKEESSTGELYRLPVAGLDKTLAYQQPAFALVNGTFLFSTNIDGLRRVLDVIGGRAEPISKLRSFGEAIETVGRTGNTFLFVDGDRLMPYLRDRRHGWAFDETMIDKREIRKQAIIELTEQYEEWTNKRIQEEADRRVEDRDFTMKRDDFPTAIKLYLERLGFVEPLDWFALTTKVSGDTGGPRIEVKGELRLRAPAGGGSAE
ncbi:MAG: hypothetical protein ABFS86_06270 [Planctomycetota bacterium]